MRYRKESIIITLLIISMILGIGSLRGFAQAMDCTADVFNTLGLTDEEFGKSVTNITATLSFTYSPSNPPYTIEYCDVKGTMWPEIVFEVLLPTTTWNHKLYMVGNGLQAGSIPKPLMIQALWQGYASTGTDTGHDAAKYPGNTFYDPAYNPNWDQATKDFAYRAVHETALIAKKIIQAYYGTAPVYSYWVGCSTGGRQGLKEAQQYPDDFDGIVAGDPVNNWAVLMGGPAYLNPQAPTGSPSQIPPDKLSMLGEAVYKKCDGIDGLVDGLIDDPRNCTFDPEQDLVICPEDIDGPACFTIAQVIAIKKIYSNNLSNGALIMPGIPKGAEAYVGGWYPSFVAATLEQTLRYQRTSDYFQHRLLNIFPPPYNFLTQWNWDIDPPKLAAVPLDYSGNAVNPDLSTFKAHGGKLLMYHGWADAQANPLATSIAYYHSVQNLMGDQTKDVLSFYMVPGMGHCGGGVGCGNVNWFAPLVNWVEQGIAPGRLIGSSTTSLVRTRPICRYPEVARYSGTGNVNDAANFMCVPAIDFYGFFSPIDNLPTANNARAGQAIPVKWRLTDTSGMPISDQASFTSLTSYDISCDGLSGEPETAVEEYTAGSSGLQYLGDGYWQFNWKTPKTASYVNHCRKMVLTLGDGTMHEANFKFK